ncbi:hypothetical protein BH20ACT9_BH20ACT9_15350 [soil metagenome]
MAVSADRALRARAGRAGADPLDDLVARVRELRSAGWRVRNTTAPGGTRTVEISTAFADPAELGDLSAALSDALAAPEVRLLSPLHLAARGRRLVLRGGAGLQPTPAVRELGLTPAGARRLAAGVVVYEVSATFPRRVLRSTGRDRGRGPVTGDPRRGTTVTWRVPPGARVRVRAVGTRPVPASSPWPAVATGALTTALVGAAGLVWLTRRRRRRGTAA